MQAPKLSPYHSMIEQLLESCQKFWSDLETGLISKDQFNCRILLKYEEIQHNMLTEFEKNKFLNEDQLRRFGEIKEMSKKADH